MEECVLSWMMLGSSSGSSGARDKGGELKGIRSWLKWDRREELLNFCVCAAEDKSNAQREGYREREPAEQRAERAARERDEMQNKN